LRRFDEERRRVIEVELRKLLEVGFIKEVFHPTCLVNPVLVKKNNGKWRMCVDYTSLNKACPKVPFPLPRIDQIVDSSAGCELLCFLDAYSGYNQIKMKESDQLATSFITPFGMYCYVTMSFGLRNASATYQRYSRENQEGGRPGWRPPHRVQLPTGQLGKIEPRKMCLRCAARHVVRIHCLPTRHQGQP
jgi:hypothetical protein